MDSKYKDESSERRRDEALARRMGEALDRLAPRKAGACPDAEVIAAYHERSLQAEESAQWESHFAICGRCRRILAVLAASVDAPLADKDVAQLGELAATARTPAPGSSRAIEPARTRWLDWRVRWLAPAFGVAAALAVWFAMRPPWRSGEQNPSATLIAQAPRSEPPPIVPAQTVEQFSKAAPEKGAERDSENAKRQAASVPSPNLAAELPEKKSRADSNAVATTAPSAGAFGGVAGALRKDESDLKSAPAGAPAPAFGRREPLAPAAPPETETRDKEVAPSVAGAPSPASPSVVVAGQAPAISTTSGAATNLPAREKQKAAADETAAQTVAGAKGDVNERLQARQLKTLSVLDVLREGSILARAPSGASWWRAGKGGNIQHSTDAGTSWTSQTSPSQEDWLAGAAVSDTVCWFVGRNGAIARTTDGEHWEKITSPPLVAEVGGKLPDWVGVTAADVQAATITAGDERRFATQDGGKTWQTQ